MLRIHTTKARADEFKRNPAEIRSPIAVTTGIDPVVSGSPGSMAGSSPAITNGRIGSI
jgi:hypothetical protein